MYVKKINYKKNWRLNEYFGSKKNFCVHKSCLHTNSWLPTMTRTLWKVFVGGFGLRLGLRWTIFSGSYIQSGWKNYTSLTQALSLSGVWLDNMNSELKKSVFLYVSQMHKLNEYTNIQWTHCSFDQAEQLPKQALKFFQKRQWNQCQFYASKTDSFNVPKGTCVFFGSQNVLFGTPTDNYEFLRLKKHTIILYFLDAM